VALTADLKDSDLFSQGALWVGRFLPFGLGLANPEWLYEQNQPAEDEKSGNPQEKPFHVWGWRNSDDGEEDGKAGGPGEPLNFRATGRQSNETNHTTVVKNTVDR
jgi:hypothetical protein